VTDGDIYRATGEWRRSRRVIERLRDWYEERLVAADGRVIVDVSHPPKEHGTARRRG
jgi:hypothetical protein